MRPQRQSAGWVKEWIEGRFHRVAGAAVRRWPRPAPPRQLLRACRIISHRGEHDNRGRFENTLAAFDAAAVAGVWGIEMDIRWTRDLVPVVFHDADTRRLFARDVSIAQTPLDLVKHRFPLIPTLAEVVARYGRRLHLMLELKREPYPRPADQSRRMRRVLQDLAPGQDYHLMGLDPDMFACFPFLPPDAFVPIASLRIDRFSRMAAARGWGGLAGHWLLATGSLVALHHRMGQGVGTGFVDSRRCLFREAARGVDWIFSNRAAALQTEVGSLRSGV